MTTDNKTYQSADVNFISSPQQRTGTTTDKDARLVNCFAESIKGQKGKSFLVKRAGLQLALTTATGTGRGLYYWNNSVWSAVGNQLYRDGTAVQTLGSSSGAVGFIEYAGGASYPQNLVILDGIKGWVINTSNVITQITDADFPSPHIPHGAYLDGYLFVVKSGTADIYNSDLDNPTAWTAGSFISAEMFPDSVIALVRQSNYILAVGPQTIEYFYDAANTPGTPLARNTAAQHQFGAASGDAVLVAEEQVAMIGQSQLGGRSVWVLDGFKQVEISTEEIRTSLDAEGTSLTGARLFCIRSMGHRFLVMQLPLNGRTWVFDFEEKLWHEWKNYSLTGPFVGIYASDHPSGSAYIQDATLGFIYKFVDNLGTDYNSGTNPAIIIQATSEKMDFGTMDRKFGNRFTIVSDVPTTGLSFSLEWSDDDYQTWSSPRTIPLSSTMPSITQLGMFRRRAFRLTFNQPYPIRIEMAKFDINIGNR